MNKFTAVPALIVLAVAGIACDPPPTLEFADWTLPVPADATVHEYAPVGDEERQDLVFELVEDLVLGGNLADENTAFYRPSAVVAAANGNIFVVDGGNTKVQMFSATGEFLRTVGAAGQGPASFQRPSSAAIAGNRLVIYDGGNKRLSVWTDNGDHIADHALPAGSRLDGDSMVGLDDGSLAIQGMESDTNSEALPSNRTVAAIYSVEGEKLVELAAVQNPPVDPGIFTRPSGLAQQVLNSYTDVLPQSATTPNDVVYVVLGDEYQVQAMKPDGTTLWALRVAMPRPLFTERYKEQFVQSGERQTEVSLDFAAEDIEWPEFYRSIGSIFTDGAGRLYVYPQTAATPVFRRPPETPLPVDVYAPDGRRIASGLGVGTWSYARDDFVYSFAWGSGTDEPSVVRSRLVFSGQ